MRILAHVIVVLLVVSAGPSTPVAPAPHSFSLPSTVRVNVAGLGVTRAVIAATNGSFTVTHPEGRLLYVGTAPTLVRRDVGRISRTGLEVTRDGGSAQQLHEALNDVRLHPGGPDRAPLVRTNAFELSVLVGDQAGGGPPLFASATSFTPLRYAASAGLLVFNGRQFRGTLEIATDDEGDLIVVNHVGTADYLRSVVGSEIPNSWEPAALAAQAVAARTYLATRLARHRMYDLEGDTRDQAYGGVQGESPASFRAVAMTSGLIATYRGNPIEAYYSANAGGITENGDNVFPNAGPYLRSVLSPTDSVALSSDWGRAGYVWSRDVSAKELADSMAAKGLDLGVTERIEPVKVSPTGRLLEVRIVGRNDSRVVTGERTRYYFGVISTLYTVTKRVIDTTEVVDAEDAKRLAELRTMGADLLSTAYRRPLTKDRDLIELNVSYLYKHPDRFIFNGRGFGHGVGLSQWGMQGMALQGATFEQILKHYYTGIDVTSAGGG